MKRMHPTSKLMTEDIFNGSVVKTVIPSKDSSAKSSVLASPSQEVHNKGLAVEPSSSSKDNSQKLRSPIKEHPLGTINEKLQEHKKSVPMERCGTTTEESEFTISSTKGLSQRNENREQVLNQVADAISNPLGSSSEVIPSETSQWNPDLLNCDICKEICKRAVLVPCCKIQACNGCAVLRIMGGGICWGCSGALRSKDLVNHKYLRVAVEMFRKNRKIEANIQAALALKQTFEDKNGASSQKIQDGQEMQSKLLPEDIKEDHRQLASVMKPGDTVAKETHNCSSTERSESSKIVEPTDKNSGLTPPNLTEEHLKTPVDVKPKKFSFGWTQSMNKTPFGSPFLKKHGMYSSDTSSTSESNKINTDDCKSAKQPVETSRKVILTSPLPNIVERNICMEYGQDHKDICSSESSISRSSSLCCDSSCFSKYGSPLPQSEQSGRGAFSSTSRKSYTGGKMSKSSSVGIGRKSRSPSISISVHIGRSSNIKRKSSRSSRIQYARSRSPGMEHRWRSRSPSDKSTTPGICRGRSKSPSVQYGRSSRSPGSGWGRSKSPSIQYTRWSKSPNDHYTRRSTSPGIGCGRKSTSPSIQYARRSTSPTVHFTRWSQGSGIGYGGRSTSPRIQYARRSRSPSIGCGRRSTSIQYARRSKSPGIYCGRRSTSPSVQYARSKSPGIVCGRSRSPCIHYARRSRSPGIGCGRRSTSPSDQYARRSRSSGIGCGRRSTSPSDQYARRSRSPGISCGRRSRSPSDQYARRSKSPVIGCGRRSRSVHYARTSRSPDFDCGRRCTRPSINLQRNSKKPRTNNSGNSRVSSRRSSLETLKVSFRNDHQQLNNESSLIASYSSENESKNLQKLVDFQNIVATESEYWEQIERLQTDQERLCLAKTQFENPVCSDPRTNLTYHGYKRKKLHMLETEDVDSFYEFFTNPDVVRLKEVKSERRQKFYIKEGNLLPMPGYMQKQELRHVKDVEDVISSKDASKEVMDANEFKMLIEKGFHQKFKPKPQNVTRSAHKRYMKPLVAHFKRGHEEAMQFLKFYKSEFNRSQLEEVTFLEKMYNSFSFHYGKMQPLYCKTCKFDHTF